MFNILYIKIYIKIGHVAYISDTSKFQKKVRVCKKKDQKLIKSE
jgi:hypothetical protein